MRNPEYIAPAASPRVPIRSTAAWPHCPPLPTPLLALPPATDLPLAHAQKPRRLRLVQLRRFPAVQKIQEYRHAPPLKGFRPAHPIPSKKGQTYRTDRALPKPDISSATDKAALMSFSFS